MYLHTAKIPFSFVMTSISIRPIEPQDNPSVEALIKSVFDELNLPKTGTAYEDVSLQTMFENYNAESSAYFVLEKEGKIIGGAGIASLAQPTNGVCELQKMYFLPETRGLGLGTKLMQLCLEKAKTFGFKSCYLETLPEMIDAQKLYVKSGFEYLDKPLGLTGHTSCPIWMLKKL
jgi:putative acetyltransferase